MILREATIKYSDNDPEDLLYKSRLEGNIDDFIFIESPKIVLPINKAEKTISVKATPKRKAHKRKIIFEGKEPEKKVVIKKPEEPNKEWVEWQQYYKDELFRPSASPHEDYYSQAILIASSPQHAKALIRRYQAKDPSSMGVDLAADFERLYNQTKNQVVKKPEKIPTKEEFYNKEYWYDPKRGQHPASGSGKLPTKDVAQLEIRTVGGEPAIRIYNPWTKEEIYYYDLKQMDEAKERFKNLYDETFGITKSSLDPVNLTEINSLEDSGINIIGGIHEEETFICKFKDGSSAIHKVMMAGDIAGEVGTYEISKIVDFDVVPETIQSDYGKGKGSSQKWIKDGDEPTGGFYDGVKLEEKHLNDLSKIFILDMINGNFDRHAGNLIIDPQDHVWAIDNECIGKRKNSEFHIEGLEQFAKDGSGSFLPIFGILMNSFGEDPKMYQNFKDNVDKNIDIILTKKDEIIKYWNQYDKDIKVFYNTVLMKDAIKVIKENIEYLENYRGKL